jgi:hypothetical protein
VVTTHPDRSRGTCLPLYFSIALGVALLALLCAAASARADGSSFTGYVTDAAGTGLSGIQVAALNLDGSTATSTATDSFGYYSLSGLVSESLYRVEFSDPAGVYESQFYPCAQPEFPDAATTLQAGVDSALSATALTPSPTTPQAFAHGDASAQELLAGTRMPFSSALGTSIAVSGDTAIVGEPGGGDTPVGDGAGDDYTVGAARIYVRARYGWAEQATLTDASDPDRPRIGFGSAVAISGDTAVVTDGQPAAVDAQGMDPQAVYVFTRSGTSWTEQAKLLPAGGAATDLTSFGESVAVSGNTIAVGAGWAQWGANTDGQFDTAAGKVFIFQRTGDQWVQQTVLEPVAADGSQFGESLALQGDTLLVDAPYDSTGGPFCGSVYAYQYDGATWARSTILIPPDATYAEEFGSAVALSDGTAVIGAPGWSFLGSAYVYVLADGQWSEQAELTAPDGVPCAEFGLAVAIDGDAVAVGSPNDDLGSGLAPWTGTSQLIPGSAQLYRRVGSAWEYEAKLLGTTQQQGWAFGTAVGVTGSTALVGAPREDDTANSVDHVRIFCPYVTDANSPLSVSVDDGLLSNFAQPFDGDLTAVLDVPPANGTVTVSPDGSFVYTPNTDFTGTDTFTYQTQLGDVLSDPATVTVTVRDPVTPLTDAYGAPAGWTNHAVTVALNSTTTQGLRRSVRDTASPTTEYREATMKAPWVPYAAPIKVSTPGVSIYDYRTSDNTGNSSGTQSFVVKIDDIRPTTVVPRATVCGQGHYVSLSFRVADATPSCGLAKVVLVVHNASGKVVRKFSLGIRATNKAQRFRFRCTLRRGTYRVTVFATDIAGNRQSRAGSNRLVVG